MAEYYESMCNRYASMAEDFYRQSKEFENIPVLKEYSLPEAAELYAQHLANLEAKTRLTISAIIFQALAIEAYDRSWYVQTTTGKERVYFKKGRQINF